MEILFKYVKVKSNELRSAKPTFQSIFNVIHNQEDRIFAEYIENFAIKSFSYKQMKEYCYRMATYLKQNIKQPKGEFVGIYLENSINWIASFWALLMIGYKPLLLNCKLPLEVNNQVLKTMNCSCLVLSNEHANIAIQGVKVILPSNESINNQELVEKEEWADEIAMCTTASTLNYKVCVYSGANMCSQLLNAQDIIKTCPRIKKHYKHRLKLLAFLPFYHIFGFVATYLWFSLYGRTMVFLENYSADTILYTIRKCEVTHIFAIPMFWNSIAKEITKSINRLDTKTQNKIKKAQKFSLAIQNVWPWLGTKIAHKLFKQIITNTLGKTIKFIVTGGGYISDSTLYLLNSVGYPLANGYGTSEIGIISVELSKKPKQRIKGSVGKPLKTVATKTESDHLFVRGSSTCKSFYYKDGKRVVLDGNWFDTLDVGKFDDKNNLYIQGRLDDVIIGEDGEKINPDLIEKQLQLTFVSNYVIIDCQRKPTLIIQLPKQANVFSISNIIKEIKDNLQTLSSKGYNIQSVFYTYDNIAPKNAVKVSRKVFNKLLAENKITLHPYSKLKEQLSKSKNETSNDATNLIKKIFADVLNKSEQEIGNNQHFFLDLGGTSLDYCTCFTRIQDAFNINLSSDEKRCLTVDDFTQVVMSSLRNSNE